MMPCARGCGTWPASVSVRTTSPRSSPARRGRCASGVVMTSIAAWPRPMQRSPAICSPPQRQEKTAPDHPVPGVNAEAKSEVLILPDNNRDPELTQVLREAQEKYFARKPQRQPAEVRTGLEGQPVEPDNPVGTLADSRPNLLSGDQEQTASGPGL